MRATGSRTMSTETLNSVECRKATIEVGFEIVDVLQPDVEPQGRSTRRPFGRRTIVRTVKRNHKALEAAPRSSTARPCFIRRRRIGDEGRRSSPGLRQRLSGLTKPFFALVSRPAVTSVVSSLCGLDRPSLPGEFMGPPPPKDFLPQPRRCSESPPDGGFGPGWLITGHGRGPSTP